MEYWTILLSIVIGALSIHYLFRNFNFFKRHGIIHKPPFPIFGSWAPIIFRRMSFGDYTKQLYNYEPDAKYFGLYAVIKPVFLLRDPELIKDVLVKNFELFTNRSGFADISDPLFRKNLFSLQGQRWRDVRTLLSPAFTSSKMKSMFVLMSECAAEFAEFLAALPADKSDMDMKDAFTRYANDVIATCAFGIKIDSMRNPTNKFYVYGKEATDFSGYRGVKLMLLLSFPIIGRIFRINLVSERIRDFFTDIIKNIIATRDAENITRPDMIQLMMDTRGKAETGRELDIDDMTAQAFNFFFGGFESNASAMSFAAFEIAANPEVQEKLRQEIDKVLEESNGEATYEAINRLGYLDAVINETLRLYPPSVFVERICDNSYELPPALPREKPFTVTKGMPVWVPVYAIHHDEKYYDEPEKFRPERFLNNKTYHNSPYFIPFGLGPRMCIANRFALLELKVLLFHLLARCELKPCAKTILPVKLSNKSLMMMPEGGFWLNVQRRSNAHPTIESTITSND